MKHQIQSWWAGEKIIDDGGYVPYLVERRPWVRRVSEKNPTAFWSLVTLVGSPICAEIVGRTLKMLLDA